MGFDPQQNPQMVEAISDLLASGQYVEVMVLCSDCGGRITAVVHRDLMERMTGKCLGCLSRKVAVLVVDPSAPDVE